MYKIGLTWNVLLILFSLLMFYSLIKRYWIPLLFSGGAIAFTHGFSAIFIIIALMYFLLNMKGKNEKFGFFLIIFFLVLLVHPLGFALEKANTSVSEIYSLRSPLSNFKTYLASWTSGTQLLNLAVYAFFSIYGLNLGIKKGLWVKEKKLSLLFFWILVTAAGWYVISRPFLNVGGGGFDLFESDRFLFYLAYPASIAGAVMLNSLDKRVLKLGIIMVLILPVIYNVLYVFQTSSDMENSFEALQELNKTTRPGELVFTKEGQWLLYFTDARPGTIFVDTPNHKLDLLKSSPEVVGGIAEAELFQAINSLQNESKPRYLFISAPHSLFFPHIADWFTSEDREKFETAYSGNGSIIVRIVYFGKEFALAECERTSGIDKVEGAFKIESKDFDPNYVGEETWLVTFSNGGKGSVCSVNKENGEISII
jgi:hypothetical protein